MTISIVCLCTKYNVTFISWQTRMQRLISFAVCFLLGLLCFCLSAIYIPVLLLKARKFALLYSLGSLFFLMRYVYTSICKNIDTYVRRIFLTKDLLQFLFSMGIKLYQIIIHNWEAMFYSIVLCDINRHTLLCSAFTIDSFDHIVRCSPVNSDDIFSNKSYTRRCNWSHVLYKDV